MNHIKVLHAFDLLDIKERTVIDPTTIVDAHGLSVDSLRGSEQHIRHDLVGSETLAPSADGRTIGRSPLSLHEARTLQLRGYEVAEDAIYPEAHEHLTMLRERTPEPAQPQVIAGDTINDPDYLIWKRERERDHQEFLQWKADQRTGQPASLSAIQDIQARPSPPIEPFGSGAPAQTTPETVPPGVAYPRQVDSTPVPPSEASTPHPVDNAPPPSPSASYPHSAETPTP